MPTLRQQLDDLIRSLEPSVRDAFIAAIDDIRSQIVLARVVEALERHDVDAAIQALHIDTAAFQPLQEALRQAFGQGGGLVVQSMPSVTDLFGQRVVVRWDMSNQRAEQIIREQSSTLITQITQDQMNMVREKIEAGYSQGQGPRQIALDLAGRVSPVTKKRTGGVIGLTSGLSRTVENARVALSAGDLEGMRAYLSLGRRDKRFDATVRKAIAAGKPIPADMVVKITGRLSDSYLKLRSETISRTETAASVSASQHEAYQQMLDKTGRDPALVTRTWRSAGDTRVRHSHMVMDKQQQTGMDVPFQAPSGAMLRFPGDSSLGAPASETVNCRCLVSYGFAFAEAYARSQGR